MEKRSVDVVVISDVHLGTYGCRARELLAYLRSIAPNILILNGDIIDGWQFSKRYFPPAHMAVIKEVLNLMSRGTRVFYITGNHDELLRRYTDFQLSHFTLTDKLVLEINNRMTWIFHGDVFDHTSKGGARVLAKLGSSGYALLIQVNRMINFFLRLAGREKISFSKNVMASVNKLARIDRFERIAAELAIEKKYDYVICGHIHQPQNRVIKTEKGSVTYLNSGDWVEHLTALEFHHDSWKLFEYDEKAFTRPPGLDEIRQPSVITDEINFYINSLAL